MQLPSTLPTLDELIGTQGLDEANVHREIIRQSEASLPAGHVFTLHAELEGMKLLPVMDALLTHWCRDGRIFLTLQALYESLDPEKVPVKVIQRGEVPGRSGLLAVEG